MKTKVPKQKSKSIASNTPTCSLSGKGKPAKTSLYLTLVGCIILGKSFNTFYLSTK